MSSLEKALTRALRRTVLLTLLLIVAGALVRFAWSALLYGFAGLLLCVILGAGMDWVQRKTKLPSLASFWVTVLGLAAVLGLLAWFILPRAIAQWSEITRSLPEALSRLRGLGGSSLTGSIVAQLQSRLQGLGSHFLGVASTFSDVLGGIIVALVVGLYGAADSLTYRNGLLRIFPAQYRDRAASAFDELSYVLRWWMLGQLVPMTVLGIATMIGLWLMHIPLAFTLGLFTAMMIFIPYLGALMAGIPAALIALLQSPTKMLWVIVFFIGVHTAEGYALTPLVQRRAVRLPPVLTILAQLVMFTLTGLLGLALATPLAAASLALFRILILHDKPAHPVNVQHT